jgi:hypothetical protein
MSHQAFLGIRPLVRASLCLEWYGARSREGLREAGEHGEVGV